MHNAILCTLLIALLCISCGCIQAAPPYEQSASETPAAPPGESTATPATAAPTAEPTAEEEPEPFPGALLPREVFAYGDAEKGTLRELTVYRTELQRSYRFSHPDWGTNYGTAEPAAGMQFLFVFVRIAHTGTAKEAGAPHPASINVFYDGTAYGYRTDRVGSVTDVVDFLGTDDYYGGIIHIYETREGFLIYEVPAAATPEALYVQANLGGGLAPVWRIG
jgi:hypothetical protein